MNPMPLRTPKLFALLITVLFLSACGLHAIYDDHIELQDGKWFKNDAAKFEVMITDTVSQFDFVLNIRNNTDYRYSNLYVFLMTEFPNGNITRDTIECILANNSGKWLGKGWGSLKENRIMLKSGLQFPLKGKYEFLIQQAMRADTLTGIVGVGLRIEKTDE
jgi:gliding motility-associated lipoprotein GldH